MKIKGRKIYKPGPKDECGTPPYAIMPILNSIEYYRSSLGVLRRRDFVILEPATGLLDKEHVGIVNGLRLMGYSVLALRGRDFLDEDIEQLNRESRGEFNSPIRMVVTNPPFSVALKRRFIEKCESIFNSHSIPYALLMSATTLVEKRNGKTLRDCSLHVPYGRICYNMPSKGWGTEENPTKATFETMWYSMGLVEPCTIWYDDFDMSDHFKALRKFI